MRYFAIIEMNLVSSVLCAMIYLQNRKHKELELLSDKIFNKMIWMLIGVLLTDAFCWVFPASGSHNYTLHMLGETLYFVLQGFVALEMLLYCQGFSNRKLKRWQSVLFHLPLIFTLVALAYNFFRPFAFCVLEDNTYQRLGGFMIMNVWAIVYICSASVLCLVNYLHLKDVEKEIYRKLLIFTLVCVAAGALSTAVYGISIWPIITLALFYLFLNVHSKREQELDLLASKDGLTSLRNTVAYNFEAKKQDVKIQSGSAAFAVAVIDINGLKHANDHYGHLVGDQLIVKVSQVICRVFAHSPVFRTGGDEFVVVMEDADYQNRTELVHQFHIRMKTETVQLNDITLPVSAAIGLAVYDSRRHNGCADVYKEADRLMYEDKSKLKKQQK